MAHTKSGGTTKLGRDSAPKYLGVKIAHGSTVRAGNVIVRQRGTHFVAGAGVRKGADDTLFSLRAGVVNFLTRTKKSFDGSRKVVKMVVVIQ
ncbi:MAG: 50S ribosomal protein L27 [Parcubacteria group bacterium]|nr:50S ribosomal protein L27 [Parcubacteria group bacterium]